MLFVVTVQAHVARLTAGCCWGRSSGGAVTRAGVQSLACFCHLGSMQVDLFFSSASIFSASSRGSEANTSVSKGVCHSVERFTASPGH